MKEGIDPVPVGDNRLLVALIVVSLALGVLVGFVLAGWSTWWL